MEKKVSQKEARAIYLANNKRIIDDDVDGFVVLRNIDKVYDNRVQAVFDFNLSVKKNEFIVLVGPSGCGKSTTLRMIAGLEEITSGFLYIDSVLSNYLESKDRDIAMVFQSYALYPNMTVYDNIGFGLKARRVPKEEIKQKVFEAAKMLDLGPYLDRKPRELSGGQMQRVALGRATVRNAKLFLMDEPLSNLDAKLRVQMRSEIVNLHKRINATTIYVTHDQTEAMTMADRIVIMNKGLVQQTGSPLEIYNDPQNVFVATFIGNPPMNVFSADVTGGKLKTENGAVTLKGDYHETYAKHIARRAEFFKDFETKAQLIEEKAACDLIQKLIAELKKLNQDELKARLEEICAALKTLSVQKGFIRFGDGEAEALMSNLDNLDLKTLKRDLLHVKQEVDNTDLQISGTLKKFDSAGAFVNKEKEPVEIGKKKKKKKEPEVPLNEQNLQIIRKYLGLYSAEGAQTNAFIGIRPEDIHFYEDFKGNKSEPVRATASFVELLGSEYCIYFDLFGSRIIMKTGLGRIIKTGDEIEICFNMDKLKLFDKISGERVI